MEFAHPPPGPMSGPPPSSPMNFNMPPPMHGMPRHMGPGPGGHHHRMAFRAPGFGGYQRAPNGMPISQDDFDGKRLRKSVMRKTVDYNASIVNALEVSNSGSTAVHRGIMGYFTYTLLFNYSLAFGNVTGVTGGLSSQRISIFRT